MIPLLDTGSPLANAVDAVILACVHDTDDGQDREVVYDLVAELRTDGFSDNAIAESLMRQVSAKVTT